VGVPSAEQYSGIEHLEKYQLIRETQHGFVRKISCFTDLLIFTEEVTNYIDIGYPVDVVYLYFRKAFDKVPHHRLILKSRSRDIGGEIVRWMESWLNDRQQRVVLGGQISDWRAVVSGVPQRSVRPIMIYDIH